MESQKYDWEIWVKGMTSEGRINRCVAAFNATERGAFIAVDYAADSYPMCCVRLLTDRGRAEPARAGFRVGVRA